MERFHVTPAQATVGLRAMRAIALADGDVEAHEHALLTAAAAALDVPLEAIRTPATPDEVARCVTDARARTRLVEAMEIMTLIDGKVDEREVNAVASFARALGVDDPRLANLRQILRGHVRILQLDLMRRSPMSRMAREVWSKEGFRGLYRFAASSLGGSTDAELAFKYKQLGLLPEGTFGREYWAHMTRRKYPFPGEYLGFPDELVRHDLAHVLSGYDTDVPGEVENAAFIAGFLRHDPFSYLFMIAVHTHLDIEIFPHDPSQASMGIDSARAIRGLERGMRVKRDLYDLSWDFWADFPRPLADVRAELGIDPLT
jgi:tellurite resistance protein